MSRDWIMSLKRERKSSRAKKKKKKEQWKRLDKHGEGSVLNIQVKLEIHV